LDVAQTAVRPLVSGAGFGPREGIGAAVCTLRAECAPAAAVILLQRVRVGIGVGDGLGQVGKKKGKKAQVKRRGKLC